LKAKHNLANTWLWLNGSILEFPLATRIFHSICIIAILALAYNIPLNYFVGLPLIAIMSCFTLIAIGGIYYLSRVKRKTNGAMLLFCVAGNMLFGANFFLNSGIDGPTDMFFILTMIIMVAVVPVSQYWFWVISNLAIVLTLHYLQYINPDWVPATYEHVKDRFLDVSSAYVTVLAVTLFSFYFIRKSYDSEKKSAEQKTAMMNMLNEEKNKLFSIISHDLRAPLTNVQNYLELLTEVEISLEERQDIQEQLLQSTRNTLDLLNNVLSWSKSQMDGSTFKLTSVNIYDLLSHQLLLFINIANSKKIRVEISIDPKIYVMGNGDMIQLIVRNLINNAIKFTASGGRIIVSAKQDGNNCLIMVKDNGIGKPVKLTSDIFYLNSESTAGTANEKGVGLGLVLCKEFTEAQHGRIWFACDSISGSSFFVELPLVNDQAMKVTKPKSIFTGIKH
jgi:two-component system sensor histidine kinase/response regulator